MNLLFSILKKYREVVSYGIVGGLTTLLNLVLYFVMASYMGIHYITADIIAWVICFVFSFLTNKIYVFESRQWSFNCLAQELFRFFTSSIFTGVLEVVILYVMVDCVSINGTASKLIDTVVIIIVNYLFRRLWVFKKRSIAICASALKGTEDLAAGGDRAK